MNLKCLDSNAQTHARHWSASPINTLHMLCQSRLDSMRFRWRFAIKTFSTTLATRVQGTRLVALSEREELCLNESPLLRTAIWSTDEMEDDNEHHNEHHN
jgi:hypothetical protein